ncbi:MAG: 5'-methylthioadenosine/adenosylhomocysteine nucleosidase [Lachnospiraceae bacterium]|nr:5'-methylthioadenosine/adenosylhomocysteine nucleosidase [Lachnospiraceae bacterium]MDE6251263.1 5'-methylthioadenosine/adenosylhomocysteine nucleosidase [Lachnospiraceae bacterium]
MLGIIGAMEVEVNQIKSELADIKIIKKAGMEFNSGLLMGKPVVIVRSGVGKVNAGICAQILCDIFEVDAIINTGIAGSLKDEINIGDIVLSEDALQHDMDAVAFGYDIGVIPQMEVSTFKADKKLITLAEQACKNVCTHINSFIGRIVSGDQFISAKEKKKWLTDNFNGYCTEMEGAAIAQAAYLNNVPFLIVRSISDKADDSAHMDYPAFESMAIENSVKLIKEIVKNYE